MLKIKKSPHPASSSSPSRKLGATRIHQQASVRPQQRAPSHCSRSPPATTPAATRPAPDATPLPVTAAAHRSSASHHRHQPPERRRQPPERRRLRCLHPATCSPTRRPEVLHADLKGSSPLRRRTCSSFLDLFPIFRSPINFASCIFLFALVN